MSYVASLRKTWQEKVVGYLHDANEDTPNSIDSILMMLEEESKDTLLAPERDKISKALLLLNHHTAKNREEYIREFGIRKGLKKLVISSKIRIFMGENQ